MNYELMAQFIDSGRQARLFLLLATFLWTGIYIGPSNIYFFLLAVGLSLRGLFMLFWWYREKNKIKEYLENGYYGQNINENELKSFKYEYKSFSSDSLIQFGFIISVYPFSFISHYAEKNNLETLQEITYVIVALLFLGLLGMGTRDIQDFSKDQ